MLSTMLPKSLCASEIAFSKLRPVSVWGLTSALLSGLVYWFWRRFGYPLESLLIAGFDRQLHRLNQRSYEWRNAIRSRSRIVPTGLSSFKTRFIWDEDMPHCSSDSLKRVWQLDEAKIHPDGKAVIKALCNGCTLTDRISTKQSAPVL